MDLSRRRNNRPRRRPWELLLLLFAVLMSLFCVFFATWLALQVRPDVLAEANMLAKSRADYHRLPGEEIAFAPLDPGVGIQAATDVARLARTPVSSITPAGIVLLPPTPTVTSTPTLSPTPGSVATSVPLPTASPRPTVTDVPTPTSPLPTATPTVVLPTLTATATRAPTATPAPTGTSISTPTPVPTNTPIPTSTVTPTDTPVPPTPTEVWPVVQSILPNTMVNTDTVTVTITGLNFEPGCLASLGSVPLVVSSCMPTTTVAASAPVDMVAGYYDLRVTNTDGLSGTLSNAYTATNPIPVITAMAPALTVATSTDLAIDILGNSFRNNGSPGSLRADLGGAPLIGLTFVNSTMLTATVPATSPVMALGAYTLTVTNPGPTDPTGDLVNAFSVYTHTTSCSPTPSCDDALGPPDNVSVNLWYPNEITIDFGIGSGITDGPGYDMVFYEYPNRDIDPAPGDPLPGILLDYITIELVEEISGAAYTVFEWNGDDPGTTDVIGTNVDGYANDSVPPPYPGTFLGEFENEPIPSVDLYPGTPPLWHNTGIAIDIGVAGHGLLPPDATFRWVRISVPFGSTDEAEVDAVLRLH